MYGLWKEYEIGFSGYKPAKDWIPKERGRDKYKYYKQNVFLSPVCIVVRAEFTAEKA